MSRLALIAILVSSLGVLGCGSTGGSDGGADDGGSDGGAEDAAADGGFSAAAIAFCSQYETVCGFGTGGFASAIACQDVYDNNFSAARQSCVETHLGYAESMQDPETHCPHASGLAPCDASLDTQ